MLVAGVNCVEYAVVQILLDSCITWNNSSSGDGSVRICKPFHRHDEYFTEKFINAFLLKVDNAGDGIS